MTSQNVSPNYTYIVWISTSKNNFIRIDYTIGNEENEGWIWHDDVKRGQDHQTVMIRERKPFSLQPTCTLPLFTPKPIACQIYASTGTHHWSSFAVNAIAIHPQIGNRHMSVTTKVGNLPEPTCFPNSQPNPSSFHTLYIIIFFI